MLENLTALSDQELCSLFRERGVEPAILEALNEELKNRESDEAIALHLQVAAARRNLRRSMVAPERPATLAPVRNWLQRLLQKRNLSAPDGRPLYRYRMADNEYDDAKGVLRHLAQASRLENPDWRAGALFVAFCAEWFRRESRSTFLRWDEIAPDLFPSVPYSSKQSLTETGLKYWRRRLRRSAHAREFLLTLALEGGIPVRVFVDGARSWLNDYLRAILRRAAHEHATTEEQLLDVAREERWRVRKSYDHDDFVAVCSELAGAVLQLRQEAEANGVSGIANSAILDATHPGWRDELPVYVPVEDEALARDLLTGLLDEKLAGLLTRGVDARRYLVKRNDEWMPALQLLADGEIAIARLSPLSGQGRVRAVPAGELANHVGGEIALLEPPAAGQKSWRMRPLMRTSRLLRPFRFEAPVVVTLSSPSDAPVAWSWPGGDARRSELMVFEADESIKPNEPLLRLLRTGSTSSPAEELYVLIPSDWSIEPSTDDAVVNDEEVPSLQRRLVQLRGTAYFRSDSEPARYRVEPNSQARVFELQLPFDVRLGCRLAEADCELVPSPASPLVRDGDVTRPPNPGEVLVRQPRGRWTPLKGPLEGSGLLELSLRDPVADIQIDKVRIALVPKEARIEGRMTGPLAGNLRLSGLPGWTASAPQLTPSSDPDVLKVQFVGRPTYQLRVTLRPPAGPSFDALVPLVGRDAVVALEDGTILQGGVTTDMRALRGALVFSPSRAVVELAPKGSRAGGVSTVVDGELPLGILRGAMRESFASLDEQDELLELAFLGDTRLPIRVSRFREGQLAIEQGKVRWQPRGGSGIVRPIARMVLEPRHEHPMEPDGPDLWGIPQRCYGPCLVYLRDGIDVITRPGIIAKPLPEALLLNPLQAALTVVDYAERQQVIEELLPTVAREGGTSATLSWLLEIAVNLRGLPASSIDVLRLLPSCPETAISMLLNARDADRATIWSLQDELPLIWLSLPALSWQQALWVHYAAITSALEAAFDKQAAASMAINQLNNLRSELASLEPALAAVCGTDAQQAEVRAALPPLNLLTSSYVGSQHDGNREARNELGARLQAQGIRMPIEIESKSHTMFAGLFAPLLLAASAAGKLKLEREDTLLIRRVLREDPSYVACAWVHLLSFYGAFDR